MLNLCGGQAKESSDTSYADNDARPAAVPPGRQGRGVRPARPSSHAVVADPHLGGGRVHTVADLGLHEATPDPLRAVDAGRGCPGERAPWHGIPATPGHRGRPCRHVRSVRSDHRPGVTPPGGGRHRRLPPKNGRSTALPAERPTRSHPSCCHPETDHDYRAARNPVKPNVDHRSSRLRAARVCRGRVPASCGGMEKQRAVQSRLGGRPAVRRRRVRVATRDYPHRHPRPLRRRCCGAQAHCRARRLFAEVTAPRPASVHIQPAAQPSSRSWPT